MTGFRPATEHTFFLWRSSLWYFCIMFEQKKGSWLCKRQSFFRCETIYFQAGVNNSMHGEALRCQLAQEERATGWWQAGAHRPQWVTDMGQWWHAVTSASLSPGLWSSTLERRGLMWKQTAMKRNVLDRVQKMDLQTVYHFYHMLSQNIK